MFSNIGGKIKKVAVVFTWIGIVLSFIGGMIAGSSSALSGFLIIVVGCVASWLSSLTLYGFGELIDSNKKMETYLSEIHYTTLFIRDEVKERAKTVPEKENVEKELKCPVCGSPVKYGANFCTDCGLHLPRNDY